MSVPCLGIMKIAWQRQAWLGRATEKDGVSNLDADKLLSTLKLVFLLGGIVSVLSRSFSCKMSHELQLWFVCSVIRPPTQACFILWFYHVCLLTMSVWVQMFLRLKTVQQSWELLKYPMSCMPSERWSIAMQPVLLSQMLLLESRSLSFFLQSAYQNRIKGLKIKRIVIAETLHHGDQICLHTANRSPGLRPTIS